MMGYEALRPHNVDGTRELLRLAGSGVAKEFHLISTTFIFGWSAKDVVGESDDNVEMENLDFGYAQSKWVAEQLVLGAEREGLRVRLYRPAFLTVPTTGAGSRDDVPIRLLAFMIKYGIAVEARNQVSFLPADVAAHNIAGIFGQRTPGRTFLVTVDALYSLSDVTRAITRQYGYSFAYYDIPGFIAEMNRRCTRDDLMYPLLDFFNRSHDKVAKMQNKRYDNSAYRRARATPGSMAEPTLDETVSYMVEYLLRERLIPKAP
jgi:thioester reductase-like protein